MAMSAASFSNLLRAMPDTFAADPLERELDEAGAVVRDIQSENFRSEKNAKGSAWAPRKRKYPHAPLRKTYKMFGAATVKGAPGNINRQTHRGLKLGVDGSVVRYAAVQQFGSRDQNRKGAIPPRQYHYVRRENYARLKAPLRIAQRRIIHALIRKHQDR